MFSFEKKERDKVKGKHRCNEFERGNLSSKIKITHNFSDAFGRKQNKKRVGQYVVFDMSDQIRDTRTDANFARQIAREYGVPVRFGEGWVKV